MSDQEKPTQKLRLMKTGYGDQCLAEWDTVLPETVNYARSSFMENLLPGRIAFRLDGPGLSTPITEFDETAPEILIVPAIQGG